MLKTAARVGLLGLVAIGAVGQRGLVGVARTSSQGMPVFQVDPAWPKLPNNWVIGIVSSVAVDRRDHVWILHRPRTVPAEWKGRAAPPVLEFDADGKFVQAWGGAGARLRLAGRRSTGSPSTTKTTSGSAAAADVDVGSDAPTTCCSSSRSRASS